MNEWISAIGFAIGLVAFVLGLTSIIMGFISSGQSGPESVKQKIEYGFFGVTGLVVCLLMGYALS